MKPQFVLILFIAFMLRCSAESFSQTTDSAVAKIDTSSEIVAPPEEETDESSKADTDLIKQNISIKSDSILDYKKRKEFAYIYNLDSLLKQSSKLIIDTINIDNLNRAKPSKKSGDSIPESTQSTGSIFDNGFIKIFLWILAISFIVFVLYKLFLGEGMFRKEPVSRKAEEVPEETRLEPSGYDKLINEAIANKNYRLAIRYHYLQALQNLNVAGAIHFSTDKTNYEYVRELSNKVYQNNFASITLNYEYVWYGHFDIDEAVFSRLQKDYRAFNQKI